MYFRKDYAYFLFASHGIIKTKEETILCTIDLKKAFHKIWTVGLWSKLLSNNIDGRFTRIIHNMY